MFAKLIIGCVPVMIRMERCQILMGWKAVSQILVIFSSKYVGISLFQFDIAELFNIALIEWFLVRRVGFEIRDNLI